MNHISTNRISRDGTIVKPGELGYEDAAEQIGNIGPLPVYVTSEMPKDMAVIIEETEDGPIARVVIINIQESTSG